MEWVETEGKTKLEALEKALNEIGLPEEKVKIETVQENKKRFGLIGSNYVRIRVHYDTQDRIAPLAINAVGEILSKMDITYVVERADRDGTLCLNITSPQSALIIGKGGQTIDALQYLVNRMVSKKTAQKANILLDTENYREKHVSKIQQLARRMADQVRSTGKPVVLSPMSSQDRKIVHLALQDDTSVRTFSKGEGAKRKIKISPRREGERE